MTKIVHIGGPKGVGKTSVSEAVKTVVSDANFSLAVLSGSSQVYDEGRCMFNKEWSELTENQRKQARQKSWETVTKLPYDVVLLDSHYVDIGDGHYKIILDEELWKDINYHVVLEAPIEMILLRRRNDQSRDRGLDINEIKYEAEAERSVAEYIARKTNVGISIIQTDDFGNAVKGLYELLRRLR